jgi:hypothetical protein
VAGASVESWKAVGWIMKLELAWNGVLELGVFKSFLGSCAMGYNFCRGILGETYGSVRTKIVGRGKHGQSGYG